MKSYLREETFLWIISLLQPVSVEEIEIYFKNITDESGWVPPSQEIIKFIKEQLTKKNLLRVARNPNLYSITSKGNKSIKRSRRLSRDKFRLFLLKNARKNRMFKSYEGVFELDGVSPSMDKKSSLKGREANKLCLPHPSGQIYWPRIIKQLQNNTGQLTSSYDYLDSSLISFFSKKQLAIALKRPEESLCLDFETLGTILGISPELIMQIFQRPERHYKEFQLYKRSGGYRKISSPRTFLKVIQQYLADCILIGLPVHKSVHSFRLGHSILSNASNHVDKAFVGNIDISNYFGSIKKEHVINILNSNGFSIQSALVISQLCTLNQELPQGAPTSPILSNTYLYKFDLLMEKMCTKKQLSYSRYADDISISGNNRKEVKDVIEFANFELKQNYGLDLNTQKTRIASSHGQQKVTGLIVNEEVKPPRIFRRKVRSAFHNASKEKQVNQDQLLKLAGYLSYLKSFTNLAQTAEINSYEKILKQLKHRLN